ncbi:Gfo/Idh/MocA family oxidoreductase [Amycolatopsis sp. NBC_00345]|uniref:Gfo/Idh/MocA family protein n=1 Tax=Amycolatopsis sp. NBC_00345 TaxID=2975955 RepID=UPI002E27125C
MLGFGIIGCGSVGGFHARLLTGQPALRGKAELITVASRDPLRAKELAGQAGCEANTVDELLDRSDVDAVCLCTPSGTHAELGERVLARGKHLLVEKPIDVTLAAADRLIAAAGRSGTVLDVVSQHRFDRAATVAKQALAAGELGRITSVSMEIPLWRGERYYQPGGWRGTRELDGGGALINQGVHLVDLAQWLLGPVVEVNAHTATRAHTIEVEDVVSARVLLGDGVPGTLLATTAAYPGRTTRLAVHGDRGSLVIDDDQLVYFHAARPGAEIDPYGAYGAGNQAADRVGEVSAEDLERDRSFVPYQPFRDQLLEFCAAVESGGPAPVGGAGGRSALAAVLAVYESAAGGRTVTLGPGAPPAPAAPPLAEVFDRCAATYDDVGVDHFTPMGQRLVDLAGLSAGDSVLDAGCGAGACLVPAAQAVGPTGYVLGIDISAGMVERAERAARRHGLRQVRCAVADAETVVLNVPFLLDGTFDAVVSGMALFLMPDPAAAVARFAELLRAEGRLAVSWWAGSDPRWAPVFSASSGYGRSRSAHELAAGSPFGSVDALHELLTATGFTGVATTEVDQTTVFTGPDQWWTWLWSTAGRLFWETIPSAELPAAEAAVNAELAKLAERDGSLRTTGTMRVTTATRSADW